DNKANVVLGPPATGKSAIMDIIEYCIGAKKSRIPKGEYFECVDYYSIRISLGDKFYFIGREAPREGFESSESICILALSHPDEKNAHARIVKNSNRETLVVFLDDSCGIEKITFSCPNGNEFDASIRHVKNYSFLSAKDLISNAYLFH